MWGLVLKNKMSEEETVPVAVSAFNSNQNEIEMRDMEHIGKCFNIDINLMYDIFIYYRNVLFCFVF